MLREAEQAARREGVANVEWVRGSSAELPDLEPALGQFDLVTIGTAFHFMDPRTTLRELRRIAPGGAVAVAYNGTPMWLHPDPWARALRGVLESRLGPVSDTDFTTEALRAAEDTMRDLGYAHVERWEHAAAEPIDVDFIVGHILSATSPEQIPPEQRDELARDVSDAISAVATPGDLIEHVHVRAVLGRTDA
jgi:hypothetical protein